MTMTRRAFGLTGTAFLAGCAVAPDPATQDLPDMGNFQLLHNIVVTRHTQVVPPSREASLEDWERVLKDEVDKRFGGYKGGRNFHIAISIDAYSLALPGIPLVVAPKSVLIGSANVWDDALRRKLHDEPEQITVFEGGPDAVVGSGLTKSADEQMRTLSRNLAFQVQKWMLENPEWFGLPRS